ncbi:invasion associated locus B family protein [Roseospira navarrensis]|uniref:Uncharacterized protein n=1 Tax=Roseospira navarrensis TaxID=140058 RepID=A0A7X2D3T1_9PROT|nr:invasion associated locus B family protein [Roseospira navarrensis]MQX35947.1 hypothetical protein [Roseospira navarrensis]
MMVSTRGLPALAVLAGIAMAMVMPPAQAQEVKTIGKFRDWTAYTHDEGGNTVCYVATRPTEEEGNYTRRDEVFAIVSHRPAEGARNVVSFIAGYEFKDGSEVSVSVDGRRDFTLFTHGDAAWAYDEDDAKLVDAMKAGSQMVVKGTSSRGTLTTDSYSLMGFTNAHSAISSACP